MAIELTQEQRHQAVVEEATHQLTVMKQYLTDEEKQVFLFLIDKYATQWQREQIMEQYERAWG